MFAFVGWASAAPLPDGRAYEQATPVAKNGLDVQGKTSLVQSSSDGSAVEYPMMAPLPGAQGAQEIPSIFRSERRAGDWSTRGLQPPAALAAAAHVLGWTENLTESFVVASAAEGEAKTAYMEDDVTGVLTPMGQVGTRYPFYVGASQDGSVVAFESNRPLTTTAVNNRPNVYVWNRETDEIGLASVLNDGSSASTSGSFAGPYNWWQSSTTSGGAERGYFSQADHVLSDAGSSLWFTSGTQARIYLRENPASPQSAFTGEEDCSQPAAACTRWISRPNTGVTDANGEKPAIFQSATPDGRTAFFMSSAKLTSDATTGPTDLGNDLYRYEVDGPAGERLTDLTPDTEPGDPNGAEVRGVVGTSRDGSYVYFVANGVLATGATPGDCTPLAGGNNLSALSGNCNLYVWHDGETEWISELSAGGAVRQSDAMDWVPTFRLVPEAQPTARVTTDGTSIVFASQEQLTGYENDGEVEFYLHRYGEPGVTCLSCDPTGAPPVGGATLENNTFAAGEVSAAILTRNLSASGDRFFFQTPDALVSSDVNGELNCEVQLQQTGALSCQDVYEWEAPGTGSCTEGSVAYVVQDGGCLYLISADTGNSASFFVDASEEGDSVFFETRSQLVAQDRDQLVDIYDARVGGGLASQNQQEAVPCVGESCRGPSQAPPAPEAAATPGFSGPGNQSPVRRCSAFGHRAKRLSRQAKQLRRAAKQAAGRHRAGRLRHRADRFTKRARHAGHNARTCRRSVRRAAR